MLALVLAPALMTAPATVDPCLDEALQLLAALQVHDASGQPIGPCYASLPNSLSLTLMIAEMLLVEDQRAVEAGLVHELRHASDFDLIAVGLLEPDCVELEARAFEAQAIVTRAFWPDDLPSGSDWEKGLAMNVATYESGGLDALRTRVGQTAGYRRECRTIPAG